MILVLRTDAASAYVALWGTGAEVTKKVWNAGRELSQQLLQVIDELCEQANIDKEKLEAVVAYTGPGSYTGLRIGVSVANAIGYSYSIPVVGAIGHDWIVDGLKKIAISEPFQPVIPTYGGNTRVTQPKK